MEAFDVSSAETVLPPTSLNAPGTDRTTYVQVTWGASPTAGVTRYELEHRRTGTESWTVGYRGPLLSATLHLTLNASFELRVRACTAIGCSGYVPNPPRIVIETPTFPDFLPETCPAIPVSVPAQENAGAIAAETGVSGGGDLSSCGSIRED